MTGQLPWDDEINKEQEFWKMCLFVSEKKNRLRRRIYQKENNDYPAEFLKYFKYCSKLSFASTPYYGYLRNIFKDALLKKENNLQVNYEWKLKRNKLLFFLGNI